MNWPAQNNSGAWLQSQTIKAKPHCCEEASNMSGQFYIPCNNPATRVVGWKGRSDNPIRMCEMCADHNVRNRNGYIVEDYTGPTGASQAWPKPNADWAAGDIGKGELPAEPAPVPPSLNPLDAMSEDDLLMMWQKRKEAIEVAKDEEMALRKYIVSRAFPQKTEGTNTKELGQGYQLKAVVKYNYNLSDNDTVENTLEKLSNLGNQGSAISDRLVSWKPSFLLGEYRQLQEDKEKGSKFAADALAIINEMLTITEGAPTLDIKAPKAKK